MPVGTPGKPHLVTKSTRGILTVEAAGHVVIPKAPCIACSVDIFLLGVSTVAWHCVDQAVDTGKISVPEEWLQPIDPDAPGLEHTTPITKPKEHMT